MEKNYIKMMRPYNTKKPLQNHHGTGKREKIIKVGWAGHTADMLIYKGINLLEDTVVFKYSIRGR